MKLAAVIGRHSCSPRTVAEASSATASGWRIPIWVSPASRRMRVNHERVSVGMPR